ncbi:MAG TPA: efflux RND transporter periplasmic adaptor subunit, partial [Burkholderiales bacterium]|nr:efflux RND transporter periplasmic adaptor subunit [Burkholderiales bacterium]
EEISSLLAPLVDLKQRADQPWPSRAREQMRVWWTDRKLWGRRLAWLGVFAVAAMVALVPVSHRIGAPARLEGAVQRVLAAPTDGYLHAVHVRPGDAVKTGQLLVELAQEDLMLESRRWEAELTQHENNAAAALARIERAQYAQAQAKAAEARAQLELVRARLARTQLASPIDGIVIKGDLSQSLGAPVQRGEVLLTIAPREAFRLIVEVDEGDIGLAQVGQHGQVALSALPGERVRFAVTRIGPLAVTAEGRNVFEVEAAFDAPLSGLRPGLQGVAKIDTGSAALGWVLSHRFMEWLKLALWKWSV